MNTILKRSLIVVILSPALFFGCDDDGNVGPDDQVNPIEIPANVSEGTTAFAFDFFHTLQKNQPSGDNLFVSPLSLHMALGMLLNGAENETAQEILKTLKMEGISISDLNSTYNTLINDLPVADSKVSLGLANSLWYRSDFKVETDFQNVMKNSFHSEITGLPFNDTARDKINQWASDKTKGKITKVIDEINPGQVMFLMNALYFKGDWKTQFDTQKTVDAAFKLEDGRDKTVKMMYAKSNFKVASDAKYNAVMLPYASGQFNMTLLIPQGQHTLDQVLEGMTAEQWKALQSGGLTEKAVTVGLPRFKLNYSGKLNKTLTQMGIHKVFTDAAELGKINKTADLLVSFVKQDAYLGIDEQGTEAAAVTTIGIDVTSVGPEEPQFICDKPFALIISESTSNTILFMGRIKNPDSQ